MVAGNDTPMSDAPSLLHAVLLHGVPQPAALRECVQAFAAKAGVLLSGPSALFVGDAIEKGQTGPDRRHDLSGTPLFFVVTPLARDATEADTKFAADPFARCATRAETWLLREGFAHHAARAAPAEEPWLQIVMMNVDYAVECEFNEWYENEHAARIASAAPEFVSVHRMEAVGGSPRHHAFWRLTDRKAPERDPWLSASETPWTLRIRRFMRDRRRLLLAPLAA
jgi:hypothetical protein